MPPVLLEGILTITHLVFRTLLPESGCSRELEVLCVHCLPTSTSRRAFLLLFPLFCRFHLTKKSHQFEAHAVPKVEATASKRRTDTGGSSQDASTDLCVSGGIRSREVGVGRGRERCSRRWIGGRHHIDRCATRSHGDWRVHNGRAQGDADRYQVPPVRRSCVWVVLVFLECLCKNRIPRRGAACVKIIRPEASSTCD